MLCYDFNSEVSDQCLANDCKNCLKNAISTAEYESSPDCQYYIKLLLAGNGTISCKSGL
jgi:hypothetical protein